MDDLWLSLGILGKLEVSSGPIFSGIATSGYRDLSGYRDQWDIAKDDIATSKKVQNLDYTSPHFFFRLPKKKN